MFSVFGQTPSLSQNDKAALLKQEYLYAFTEATKQFLFGNYIQAVSLYKECLKIDPYSGAVHFQLSRIYTNAGNTVLGKQHALNAVKYNSDNIWYLQNLANIYQLEENSDSALRIYKALNALDPENVNIIYYIAGLCEKLELNEEALVWLDQIDRKIGYSREVAVSKFRLYEKVGFHDKAIESLKKGITNSEEGDYNIMGMIAEYYRNNGQLDSAALFYSRIFPEFKSDPLVTFSYTGYLMDIGKRDSAKRLITSVMQDTSYDAQVKTSYLYNILQNDRELVRYSGILDTLSEILYRNNENDLQTIAVFADIQLRLRNFDKAANVLKKLVAYDRMNYSASEQLLYILNIMGQPDSVIYYSTAALKIWDEKPFIYLFRGSAFYQKKFYEEAIFALNKGLELSEEPSLKVEFFALLAECYQIIKQYDKSEESFKSALVIDKNNSGIKNNFAYYLSLREKDLKYAEELSSETIVKEPKNGTYLDTYAWILFKQKRISKARKFIIEALKFGGSDSRDVLMHAAEIHFILKEYQVSLKYYQDAAEKSEGSELSEVLTRMEEVKKKIREE